MRKSSAFRTVGHLGNGVSFYHLKKYASNCDVFASHSLAHLFVTVQLRPHHTHRYDELVPSGPVTHVRLIIRPDGGISRFRIFGRIALITAAMANQQRPSSRL